MNVVDDELELHRVIAPALERLALHPRAGMLDRMLSSAVAVPQRPPQFALRRSVLASARVFVATAVVVGGISIGMQFRDLAPRQPSGLLPPMQVACRWPIVPDCVEFRGGSGYGMPRPNGVEDDILSALANLGSPYAGPRGVPLSSDWPLPLSIEIYRGSGEQAGPLKWRSSSGEEGEVDRFTIDLTQLAHGKGPAFVLLNYLPGDYGQVPEWYVDQPEEADAYELPDALGRRLLNHFDLPSSVGP